MDGAFLDWALAAFSGYVAVDELYEGPYCVLSAVDNRQYKRILYAVLAHDPTHDDIKAFLGRLKTCPEGGCQGVFMVVQDALTRFGISDELRRMSVWR